MSDTVYVSHDDFSARNGDLGPLPLEVSARRLGLLEEVAQAITSVT